MSCCSRREKSSGGTQGGVVERHGALPRGLALAARNLQKGVERQPAAAVGGDPARPERRELRLELGGVRGNRDASEFALVVQVAGHRFGAEAQLELAALEKAAAELGKAVYDATAATESGEATAGGDAGTADSKGDDDVIDAEFEVKDEK